MKYSIVMPVFLREDAHKQIVLNTLESIKQNSSDCEIIIVDDGSTLLTGFLRDFADTYIRHLTNKGIAPSWNDGIAVARGEYVVVINDDIKVPDEINTSSDFDTMWETADNWLDFLSLVFERKSDCGVSAPSLAGPNIVPSYIDDDTLRMGVKNHKFYPGYCFMLKRDRFLERFDEQFVPFNLEDTDYWERIMQKGLHLYRAPLAIWHAEGDVVHKLAYNDVNEANRQKFIKKHGFDPITKFYS